MIRPTVEEFIKTAVPSVPRVDRLIGWECAQEKYRARAYQVDGVDFPGGPDVEDTPGVAPGLEDTSEPRSPAPRCSAEPGWQRKMPSRSLNIQTHLQLRLQPLYGLVLFIGLTGGRHSH